MIVSKLALFVMTVHALYFPNSCQEFYKAQFVDLELLTRYAQLNGIATAYDYSTGHANFTFYCSEERKESLMCGFAQEFGVSRSSQGKLLVLESNAPALTLPMPKPATLSQLTRRIGKKSLVANLIHKMLHGKKLNGYDVILGLKYQVRPWLSVDTAVTDCVMGEFSIKRKGSKRTVNFFVEI